MAKSITSADVFRALHTQREDMVARELIKGLEMVVAEGHRALESLADMRAIQLYQGRIALARHIIKEITDPQVKGRKADG